MEALQESSIKFLNALVSQQRKEIRELKQAVEQTEKTNELLTAVLSYLIDNEHGGAANINLSVVQDHQREKHIDIERSSNLTGDILMIIKTIKKGG